MRSSEQTDSLFKAMVSAIGEMPSVKKDATNPHFGKMYAGLDSVVSVAQPILAKHGLAVITGGGEVNADAATVTVTTRVIHESGQWIASDLHMVPRKNDPQGIGACVTYASRYGYRMIGLVTEEDDDGNGNRTDGKKPPASKPTAKKPAAPAQKNHDWVDVCKASPPVAEAVKKTLKLKKSACNKIWAECTGADPDQEFMDKIQALVTKANGDLPLEK